MLTIRYHNSFKKDYKKILKRHLNIHDMETVMDMPGHKGKNIAAVISLPF